MSTGVYFHRAEMRQAGCYVHSCLHLRLQILNAGTSCKVFADFHGVTTTVCLLDCPESPGQHARVHIRLAVCSHASHPPAGLSIQLLVHSSASMLTSYTPICSHFIETAWCSLPGLASDLTVPPIFSPKMLKNKTKCRRLGGTFT